MRQMVILTMGFVQFKKKIRFIINVLVVFTKGKVFLNKNTFTYMVIFTKGTVSSNKCMVYIPVLIVIFSSPMVPFKRVVV